MFCIDVQANDMNFVVFPDRRDLNPGHQIQRQSAADNLGARGGNAVSGIVIGYCQRADTHFNGAMDGASGVSRPSEACVWLCKS